MTRRLGLDLAIVLAALAAGLWSGRVTSRRAPDLDRYRTLIAAQAAAFGVDPSLLTALVAAESGGDPEAVSAVGAIGLCQLMPETAAEQAALLGVPDFALERLTEPELNLRLGAAYLHRQLVRFEGQRPLALAAYNAGATHAQRWANRAPDVSALDAVRREGFGETRAFVARVLRLDAHYAGR